MRKNHWILGVLALAFVGALALGSPALAQDEAATYVGAETCAECHGEVADALVTTGHGQAGFGQLSSRGCETCHGPGSVHVDDPESWNMRVTDKAVREQTAICQNCHDGGAQFFWKGGVHDTRGLTCTTCHSVHSPVSDTAQLKTSQVMDTCLECHKDVRADLWKNSHHPIREGRISCVDCHNPHGTQTEKMIKAVSVNDQCYECHAEKRGPFLWEHPPVRESCMNCHTPHGSNHIKLQRTTVPYLCQQCHSNTRHPGTLYDNTRLPTLEDESTGNNRIFNRACLDCHAAIHGSNHPSGPYLGR